MTISRRLRLLAVLAVVALSLVLAGQASAAPAKPIIRVNDRWRTAGPPTGRPCWPTAWVGSATTGCRPASSNPDTARNVTIRGNFLRPLAEQPRQRVNR